MRSSRRNAPTLGSAKARATCVWLSERRISSNSGHRSPIRSRTRFQRASMASFSGSVTRHHWRYARDMVIPSPRPRDPATPRPRDPIPCSVHRRHSLSLRLQNCTIQSRHQFATPRTDSRPRPRGHSLTRVLCVVLSPLPSAAVSPRLLTIACSTTCASCLLGGYPTRWAVFVRRVTIHYTVHRAMPVVFDQATDRMGVRSARVAGMRRTVVRFPWAIARARRMQRPLRRCYGPSAPTGITNTPSGRR